LELRHGLGAVGLDGVDDALGEGQELLVVRDGLRLAADGGHGRDRLAEPVDDLALRRLAAGALPRRRKALLAQELLCRVQVAARLLERALAVYHPRAGVVAELLDEARRYLDAHVASTSSGASTLASCWESTSY